MKKLFFAFIFILGTVLLSGCSENNGTRNVIFIENPPNLTTMTFSTTSFVDTYSEYMATYSLSETTESGNSNTVSRPPRVAPDTGFNHGGIEQVSRDTAAVFTYVVTTEVTSFTGNSETTAVTEVPESETEITETSVVETTAETESTAVNSTVTTPADTMFRDRPKRDTVFSPQISADTVYSSSSITENGGTLNADQYTE